MNVNPSFPFVLGFALLSFTACEKDQKNNPDNEQELITTVRLTFNSASGALTFNAKDPDGDGGLAPTIDAISLKANTSYSLNIEFLDESKSPAVNITSEVREEADDHLICFIPTGSMPTPAIEDTDSKNKPVGLTSVLKTTTAGTGTLKVALKHLADKASTNACSTGDTDVEVTFNVSVAN